MTAIDHGTRDGYLQERRRHLPVCAPCRKASDDYRERHNVSRPIGIARHDLSGALIPPTASVAPWVEDAACAASNYPDQWFPEDAAAAPGLITAVAICNLCPVRLRCLQTAMANEAGHSSKARHGIYGGLTPSQRARLAKKDAA